MRYGSAPSRRFRAAHKKGESVRKNLMTIVLFVRVLLLSGTPQAEGLVKSEVPKVITCPAGLPAETACYSGKDGNDAFYLIAKPNNWNGLLVVQAHGGPSPFGDEKLATSINYLRRFSVIVREGYAWAGSSFRRGGRAPAA